MNNTEIKKLNIKFMSWNIKSNKTFFSPEMKPQKIVHAFYIYVYL